MIKITKNRFFKNFFKKSIDFCPMMVYNQIVVSEGNLKNDNGSLAQLGEHLPYKQGVTGSSPVTPTKLAR